MIISKIFTLSLNYKVKNINSSSREALKSLLLQTLSSNDFLQTFEIIAVDNEVTIEKENNNEIEFLIVSYMSLNKLLTIKDIRGYIDNFSSKYTLGEDSCAILTRRRVY